MNKTSLDRECQNPLINGMKTVGHILLLALYCTVIVGLSISQHYCGTVPVGSHLGASTAEPDWCCGENESDADCCTTVITTLIVTDDHTASAHVVSAPLDATLMPALPLAEMPVAVAAYVAPVAAFPPGSSPPLTILHNCFLI
jgi:hypothetical protein